MAINIIMDTVAPFQVKLGFAGENEVQSVTFDTDSIEYGTVESGIIERKLFQKQIPQPEEEPVSSE